MPRKQSTKPTELRTGEVGRLLSLLRESPPPVLLLGAGASVKSGIPAAGATVERAAKWSWCKEKGRQFDDPAIRKSDYHPWLVQQSWFDASVPHAQQYATAVEKLLGTKKDRRNFFEELINPQILPSSGYRSLAKLLQAGWLETVLTTNFDDCLHKAAVAENKPHYLVKIKTADDLVQFSTTPSHPQLIYLHGSVEHYTDKNLMDEIQALDERLVECIRPLLRDRPVIVVGYSGSEPSIMKGLFLDNLDYTRSFAQGVFWCIREKPTVDALSKQTRELADAIGSNFTCVQISDFDDLFDRELFGMLEATASPPRKLSHVASIGLPFDMLPCDSIQQRELDDSLLRARLVQYASKLQMKVPDIADENWIFRTSSMLDLFHGQQADKAKPTNACVLLFALDPSTWFPFARVEVKIAGPSTWLRTCLGEDIDLTEPNESGEYILEQTISGNLWSQIDQLTDLLTHFNYSFRLKAEVSKQVQAYHPIALKEMLINAVVHRDYERSEPIELTIGPHSISVRSPGGLLPAVSMHVSGQSFEEFIKSNRYGVKGYRNPVLSDLMYGSGQMDRAGSGLADMWKLTLNNNGAVTFGPIDCNERFFVEISARPEVVDEITNTAIAANVETKRYAANVMPITKIPERVWLASVLVAHMGSLRTKNGGRNLPPGMINSNSFYTFYNLEAISSVAELPFGSSEIASLSVDDLLERPNGHNIFVQLLNDLLFGHFISIGMEVDFARKRIHFPVEHPGKDRLMTYKARLKKATRTVVKGRRKSQSNEIRYYEHKALNFQVMDFGADWAIVLNPAYVFTRDGYRKTIGRERVNSLSTRRAARDFNQSVHNDVTFWIAVISQESGGVFAILPCECSLVDFMPTVLLSTRPPTVSFDASAFETVSDSEDIDEYLDELDDEIMRLADDEGLFEDGENANGD